MKSILLWKWGSPCINGVHLPRLMPVVRLRLLPENLALVHKLFDVDEIPGKEEFNKDEVACNYVIFGLSMPSGMCGGCFAQKGVKNRLGRRVLCRDCMRKYIPFSVSCSKDGMVFSSPNEKKALFFTTLNAEYLSKQGNVE